MPQKQNPVWQLQPLGSVLDALKLIAYTSSFFPFYFYFYLVCSFLSLFDVIMFGAPELWW